MRISRERRRVSITLNQLMSGNPRRGGMQIIKAHAGAAKCTDRRHALRDQRIQDRANLRGGISFLPEAQVVHFWLASGNRRRSSESGQSGVKLHWTARDRITLMLRTGAALGYGVENRTLGPSAWRRAREGTDDHPAGRRQCPLFAHSGRLESTLSGHSRNGAVRQKARSVS